MVHLVGRGLGLLGLVLVAGCGEPGGLTARLAFVDTQGRALRSAGVPDGVGRLEIDALDAYGTRLAGTVLDLSPAAGEALLVPGGGTWQIDGVSVGVDRRLSARAYLGPAAGAVAGQLAYVGELGSITVQPGAVTDVGILTLAPASGARDPALDFQAPDAPTFERLEPIPEGEALTAEWRGGQSSDLSGYLVALATTATTSPAIARGRAPTIGSELTSGVRVVQVLTASTATGATLGGLVDGVPVRALVYAYDTDDAGTPLNWSAPAEQTATPNDAAPPSAPASLTARRVDAATVELSFVAPGEDGATGLPDRYQLRHAASRSALETAFESQSALPPPAVRAAGLVVSTRAAVPSASSFVGVRAIDRAENAGPIAVAAITDTGASAPSLLRIDPALARAGAQLTAVGSGFGAEPGAARWTTTATSIGLTVLGWSDTEARVLVPDSVASGTLQLSRRDGQIAQLGPIGVLAVSAPPTTSQSPFEVAARAVSSPQVYTVHRERGSFSTPEHAVEQWSGGALVGSPLVPLYEARSTVVAIDARADTETFAVLSGGRASRMTSAVVVGSTLAPAATRLETGLAAGSVDGLALALLDGATGDAVPAFAAFTRSGILRMDRVDDLRLDPFDRFVVETSTAIAFSLLSGARGSDGAILLAVAETDADQRPRLALWDVPASGDPGQRQRRAHSSPPAVTGRPRVLAVPAADGGGFVVAYAASSANGADRVAVGRASAWGSSFVEVLPDLGLSERVEDLGWLRVGAELRLVLLSTAETTVGGTVEAQRLRWTELPLDRLSDPSAAVTVELDLSVADPKIGRLGCKPLALPTCAALWASTSEELWIERR